MRLGLICEGGRSVGWGHVSRCRALLEKRPRDAALIVGAGFDEVESCAAREGVAFAVRSWHTPTEPLADVSRDYDVLIVDHYTLAKEWIARQTTRCPVFIIDDWMRSPLSATGMINPNAGATRDDYDGFAVEEVLAGPAYCLLREAVISARCAVHGDKRDDSVLLTFGGSDPNGRTASAVEALTRGDWYVDGGCLTVVLGSSYRGPEPWGDWPSSRTGRLDVLRQPQDFLARCQAATLVVCGASVTSHEMAYLGVPFYPVALVGNQRRVAAAWRDAGVGDALSLEGAEWQQRLARQVNGLVSDAAARASLVDAASIVDGNGADRVLLACTRAVHGIESASETSSGPKPLS